jgi:threonine/homoserine/homoserine lactone efflux protein
MGSGKDQMSDEVRWGLGCLIAAAAMTGFVILLMYVAFTLDLPEWAQILLGVGLTLGGGLLTWLIFTATGQSRPKPPTPASEENIEELPRRRL